MLFTRLCRKVVAVQSTLRMKVCGPLPVTEKWPSPHRFHLRHLRSFICAICDSKEKAAAQSSGFSIEEQKDSG
jgi:hypothetical protein